MSIDLARHLVSVRGEPVNLTRSEFQAPPALAENPGQVFSRKEIMEELWQTEFQGDVRACDVHISNLRQKVERDPKTPSWCSPCAGSATGSPKFPIVLPRTRVAVSGAFSLRLRRTRPDIVGDQVHELDHAVDGSPDDRERECLPGDPADALDPAGLERLPSGRSGL